MQSYEGVIKDLEKTFFTLDQLKKVKVIDTNEKLVDLGAIAPSIILAPQKVNIPITGNTIFIREAVAVKLGAIQKELRNLGFSIKVTDGYRPVEIQEQYWKERLEETRMKYPQFTDEEVEQFSIRFTAKPEYAYHTTGGAVDLTLVNIKTVKEIDMGGIVDEFNDKAYSYFPFLTKEALANRKVLFERMDKYGFYNFPSEWWHFSYGTLDWALYFKKPHALYGSLKFPVR